MWLRFKEPHDYYGAGFTIAYHAADYNVPTAIAEAILAAGKATRLTKRSKADDGTETET